MTERGEVSPAVARCTVGQSNDLCPQAAVTSQLVPAPKVPKTKKKIYYVILVVAIRLALYWCDIHVFNLLH